jgi:hypothetical protein
MKHTISQWVVMARRLVRAFAAYNVRLPADNRSRKKNASMDSDFERPVSSQFVFSQHSMRKFGGLVGSLERIVFCLVDLTVGFFFMVLNSAPIILAA